jgi:hypothetical protein
MPVFWTQRLSSHSTDKALIPKTRIYASLSGANMIGANWCNCAFEFFTLADVINSSTDWAESRSLLKHMFDEALWSCHFWTWY